MSGGDDKLARGHAESFRFVLTLNRLVMHVTVDLLESTLEKVRPHGVGHTSPASWCDSCVVARIISSLTFIVDDTGEASHTR